MGKIDHSAAGAILASNKSKDIGRILGYLIAGHHTGLPDWDKDAGTKGDPLSERLSNSEHLQHALKGNPPENILDTPLPSSLPCQTQNGGAELVHLWIRMLYSCLVDADFLDTERFMNPETSELRPNGVDLAMLKERFDQHMSLKESGASDTPVNRARKEILRECRQKGVSLEPGLFSLTVPTGGGKTLASMAFALEHALKHDKKRIIVVIPYTSIIEQTAAVYREVFGDDAVLEHHSNLDPSRETPASRLATENWDAPIIVTTNVQFFESLFAARSSACRKLHNIVNSVVVLDEAQMLPTDFLQPIVSVIKMLSAHFRTSVVLCTATQPVLSGKVGTGKDILKGFDDGRVRELMADPEKLFGIFQRVRVRMLGQADQRHEWAEIARRLCEPEQVLCIVNTRKDCRELHDLMPDGTVHLSALMCPEHRSTVIAELKSKLVAGEPVRVVSTQLLEAGVDIDFPTVYRSFSGLDSIAQAAGRCNREGKLEHGDVVVFNPPNPSPSGRLRKAEQAAQELFRTVPELAASLMPEAFRRYFMHYFSGLNGFDTKGIMDLLASNDAARYFQIQFRTAARKFKLIDDTLQHGIIVRYRNGKANIDALIDQLRFGGPNRKLMRQLQRYSVNVYDPDLKKLIENGLIEEVHGVWVQTSESAYDPVFGLNIDANLNFYW
ncbi:MAG TPA: CRISPR-associated helicase Cas3' [Chlorobaculum sp.]|uniref:CRISPR-associated helicase Cas3 n=1 Tax=Chlorobaculum tepidum (strain ATCC 49652 / DSM 12025 / NBRC 103806 / TLS) TaxID=194439 RepID=Q8KDB9_CHLTE|nr:CRISPR-associated helicase Cas3' [Chlorobaculum tepidum]AAM72368.1 CRISPR-associated helicase Cas3 [Chlorobaculum tepidum TLS]HBU23992.1 CRISPR-associated helicase Cas3' [Chlorobaculum sp.]